VGLLEELRDIAAGLTPSQQVASAEVPALVAAIVYYIDTRLNAAMGPQVKRPETLEPRAPLERLPRRGELPLAQVFRADDS